MTATPAEEGQRLDVAIASRWPGLTRRVAKRLGLAGRLRCNGEVRPPSHRVRAGDRLTLDLDAAGEAPAPAVLAVTGDYVFVDKPADLHTHRLRPTDPPALADAVAQRHPECAGASVDPREGGALHRLDRETTGVVAFARSPAAWSRGRALLEGHAVKHYLAVCTAARAVRPAGPPSEPPADLRWQPLAPLSTWDADEPLGRGPVRGMVVARPDGLAARTRISVLGVHERYVLVAVRLYGGRRHQARVHLARAGLPIVGDPRYGTESAPAMFLHAVRLELDPGRLDPVQAPLPRAWTRWSAGLPVSPFEAVRSA